MGSGPGFTAVLGSCGPVSSAKKLLVPGTLVKGSTTYSSADVDGSEGNKEEGSSRISERNLAPAFG